MSDKKRTCLCCGYQTLDVKSIFEICPICFFQDEPICRNDPDFSGGANGDVSLRQAQKNFLEFGACEECMLDVVRSPYSEDIRDPEWRPFEINNKG